MLAFSCGIGSPKNSDLATLMELVVVSMLGPVIMVFCYLWAELYWPCAARVQVNILFLKANARILRQSFEAESNERRIVIWNVVIPFTY